MIYVLVVWLPERAKRLRIQRNLQAQYDTFKEECIVILVSALGGRETDCGDSDLKDREQFRQYFTESSSVAGQTRWDRVANELNEDHIKQLAIEFEILMAEVNYTLSVIDIDNVQVFASLKRLAHLLHRSKHLSLDYDDVKQLLRFLWSVHTGWSFSEGYPDKDPIAQIIDSI